MDSFFLQPAGNARVWFFLSAAGREITRTDFFPAAGRPAGREITRMDFLFAHARLASVGWRKNLVLAQGFSGSVSQNVPVAQRF